ncbi:MAG: FtsW/RodA/SpoVE family cell cycle protein [Phycisphaerae bacterium]
MLETLKRHLRYTSWPIIIAMVLLMMVGIVAIRSAEQLDTSFAGFARKQIIFAVMGVVGFLSMTVIPYHKIGRFAYWMFGFTLVVLTLLLVLPRALPGNAAVNWLLPDIRGAYRWVNLGVVQVQPSEFAKLSYILMLAWYMRYRDNYRSLLGLIPPFLLTIVPMGLVFLEPDLGTSLLFLPMLYFMLFMAGAKLKHLVGIVVVGSVLVFLPIPHRLPAGFDRNEKTTRANLAYWSSETADGGATLVSAAPLVKMKRHQIARIEGWLRQDDPRIIQGKGYQLHQSKLVLGSGMVLGRGDWHEADDYYTLLPDDHTDFIFSVIGGQWGFLGCLGVFVLFGVVFVMGVEIATVTNDPFGRLLAVGVVALLFSQIVINVGMTMGLMPITGMTLPLISYGGSSLLVNCMALGLLVNVGQRRPILLGQKPFEYGEKREKPPQPFGPDARGEGPGVSGKWNRSAT